jgi:hypothetical protein
MAEKKGLTNAGKKETRQYNQVLNKAVKQGRYQEDGAPKEVEARSVPKQHGADEKTK